VRRILNTFSATDKMQGQILKRVISTVFLSRSYLGFNSVMTRALPIEISNPPMVLFPTLLSFPHVIPSDNAAVLYTMEGCNEHPEESKQRFLLTDFGLSRPVDDDENGFSSGRCGTGGYRAPEVFDGRYGKRTDMFSFGCVMMDVATTGRQRAFKEDYAIRRYRDEDPNYPLPLLRAGWNTGLDDLTLRSFNKWFKECLDRNARARPRAADLLARMAKKLKEAAED